MTLGAKWLRRVAALLALLCFCASAAAQSVIVEKDSELFAAPRADAPVVAKLRRGATGETLARQGAWINLKTAAGTGWVHSFNVRTVAPGGSAAPSAAVVVPRSRPAVASTIGIRGLDAEDLRRASFDSQQMVLLDRFAASRQDAEAVAQTSGLSPARIDYFDK